jgi:hypothetical protein
MKRSPEQPTRTRWRIALATGAAIAIGLILNGVLSAGPTGSATDETAVTVPSSSTGTTPPPITTASNPRNDRAYENLVQALQPAFINPCDVLHAAVNDEVNVVIRPTDRYGELDPGFRMCHPTPDRPDWNSLHLGLYTGMVSSDNAAGNVLELLLLDKMTGPWIKTGASLWGYEGIFDAVAVLEVPYLLFVTDHNAARATRVAQAAAAELGSWEPDPNYVCGLLSRSQSRLPPAQGSPQPTALDQYATGAASFGQSRAWDSGDDPSRIHLFWREKATSLKEAEELLAAADDLDWLAGARWTPVRPWRRVWSVGDARDP